MNITEDHFRKTLGLFPTGVTVVTVSDEDGKDVGVTISSLTSVSLNPPQILFCLSKHSKKLTHFKIASHFAVNILNEAQSHLSNGFAKHTPPDMETFRTHRHSQTGCILLSDSLGHIVCAKGPTYDGGDHEIIIGNVIDLIAASPTLSPLVRQRGEYLTTQPILGLPPRALSSK